jgi:ATP:ADP antiporter, AAA family
MEPSRSPGHRSAVVAAMVAAAALIAQQVVGRATRDALFLSSFRVASLPVVMIAAAVVSMTAVLGFSAVLARRSPARVLPPALALGTVLLLAEWGLCLVQPRAAAIVVYLHLAAFGATVVSGFWSLVNERFDPHTARRVMGDIALGASLGGVGGGALAWGAAGWVPVPTMLAVMAGLNVVTLVAIRPLTTRVGHAVPSPRAEEAPRSGLGLIRELPYLRSLATIVLLGSATETLLDYVLNARAATAYGPGRPLMAFFALFYAGVALIALLVQVSLARPALRSLGLAGTVALRPATVAAAALLGVVQPALWSALLARGAQGVLTGSLFRSGYELLFTPIAERRKRPTKAIVDVGFDRAGTIGAGLVVLGLVSSAGAQGPRLVFALAAATGLATLALTRRLHRGYVSALEESLRSGIIRLDLADVVDSTTSSTLTRTGLTSGGLDLLREIAALRDQADETSADLGDALTQTIALLRAPDAETVRRGLRRPEASDRALVGHLIPLLARNELFLDVLRALRPPTPLATGQLLDALLDPSQDLAVRRRIPRVLRRGDAGRALEGLRRGLADPDFGVRRQCARTLAHLSEREPALPIPSPAVFEAVVQELARGPADWTEIAEPEGSDDPPGRAPQTPRARGLAHVFTLLALVLEREPLRIAYVALLGEDTALRGTALEYLETVLPDEVRRGLWPHLRLPAHPVPSGRTRQNLVQDLMRAGASEPRR